MAKINARIIGTGAYLPEKIYDNAYFEKILDTSDEWITERTGIKERHIAPPEMASSDLATEAAKKAIKVSGISAKDIEAIICATITPDMFFPPTACFVQKNLGIKNSAAFDVAAVCSGFIYALTVADSFIKAGKFKKVLVIGVEVMSKIIDYTDRTTCVIFGDGAGAAVVSAEKGSRGILSTHIYSDGSYSHLIQMPGGGSRNPCSMEVIEKRLPFVKMKGRETFKIAVRAMEQCCRDALETNNLEPKDIDIFVPHQANKRIIDAVAQRLKIPEEKIIVTIHKHGNTSAASVPMALNEAVEEGKIKEGDYVLMSAFGGGLSWGSILMKW
ncbi:MAG: ketoacyl-ACP synthase III [Candidatus Schekmanbacteria bacterium]|nr:MAG: ketoacyl-ACP synthase III [Candidatus Schekmanbacteria bacterium]